MSAFLLLGALVVSAVEPLPEALVTQMVGTSWHEGCPVALKDLRLVTVEHYDFDGALRKGRLVVHARAASAVEDAFRAIRAAKFPIQQIQPASRYGGSDARSMAANNSSAFNCRRATGGRVWSAHSYGTAIDINPVQNPYIRGKTIEPPAGAAFRVRAPPKTGMILDDGPVVRAFDAINWKWGGRFRSLKDYQHFSRSGR